jgi:hypothetical protein
LTIESSPCTITVVFEYASITAALSMLVASLSGVLSSVLPSTSGRASALVTAVASSHHVSTSQARAAYAGAPYRSPALRYLYSVGWVGSASDLAGCKAAQILGPDPTSAAAQALERSPKALAVVRAAHLTVNQAAEAIARGSTDGCA